MRRWMSRLLLVVWPGGELAFLGFVAVNGGQLPAGPLEAVVAFWAVASIPFWPIVIALGITEAAIRKQGGWVLGQVLSNYLRTAEMR